MHMLPMQFVTQEEGAEAAGCEVGRPGPKAASNCLDPRGPAPPIPGSLPLPVPRPGGEARRARLHTRAGGGWGGGAQEGK